MRLGRRAKRLPFLLLLGVVSIGVSYGARYLSSSPPAVWTTGRRTLSECGGGGDGGHGNIPPDLFTVEEQKQGWVVLHILGMLYMFVGLAIVCDEFFEESLKGISQALNLSEDVAGATFMAAGSSAPELFTSFMGVFVAESDIGFGTIVGSAVFNILIIVACCGIFVGELKLHWWPLTRDVIFYCLSITALVAAVLDDQAIQYYECISLLMLYGCYVLTMKYNKYLGVWVEGRVRADKEKRPTWAQYFKVIVETKLFQAFIMIVIVANVVVIIMQIFDEQTWQKTSNNVFNGIFITEMALKILAYGFFGYWSSPLNAFDGMLVLLILGEFVLSGSGVTGGVRGFRLFRVFRVFRTLRVVRLYRLLYPVTVREVAVQTDAVERASVMVQTGEATTWSGEHMITPSEGRAPAQHMGPDGAFIPVDEALLEEPESDREADTASDDGTEMKAMGTMKEAKDVGTDNSSEEEQASQEDSDEEFSPFIFPSSAVGKVYHTLAFPLLFLMWVSIPDCRKPERENWYAATFSMSIVWIAVLSYVMVWMATVFGKAIGIPDAVMGLTLLAAGTSIPDALSSISVARDGKGDMAVSNSLGSNVFDLLIGLPVPWFLKTCIMEPGVSVTIYSEALAIMVFTLFITVALVVLSIAFNEWRLTKGLAWSFVAVYGVYMALVISLEVGLFPGLTEC